MADDLEAELLGYVLAAHLPEQEPVVAWLRWAKSKPTRALPKERELRLRAHDHTLMIGRRHYRIDRQTGWIWVSDTSDPRSECVQVYQPDHPGQPYMAPSVEDCDLPRR